MSGMYYVITWNRTGKTWIGLQGTEDKLPLEKYRIDDKTIRCEYLTIRGPYKTQDEADSVMSAL